MTWRNRLGSSRLVVIPLVAVAMTAVWLRDGMMIVTQFIPWLVKASRGPNARSRGGSI